MADQGLSSKRKHDGFLPTASAGLSLGSPPAVGSRAPPPYGKAPPPPDEIQIAPLHTQSIAAKRPRVDSTDGFCEGSLCGGSLGFSSSAGGGGDLGFSSSAGGGSSSLGFSSSAGGSSSSLGFSSSAGGGGGGGGLGFSSSSSSGAKIQVTPHPYANAMSQLSSASGMSGDVTELSTISCGQNLNALGPTTSLDMKILNSKIGLVIGKFHRTLNWLRSISGASIELIHSDCTPGVASSETTVHISGKPANVIKAKDLLDDLIRKDCYYGYPGKPPKRELGHAFKLPGAYPGAPCQPYGTCAPTSSYRASWNQLSGPYPLQNGWHQAHGQASFQIQSNEASSQQQTYGQASYSGSHPQGQQHTGDYQQSYIGGQPPLLNTSPSALNHTGEQVFLSPSALNQATGLGSGPPPISVTFPQQPTVTRPQQVAYGVPPPMPFRVAQPPQQVAFGVPPPMPFRVAQPPPGCGQGGQPYGSGGYG